MVAIAIMAIAAPKATAADAATTARDSWQRGIEAYGNHDYATAVEAFENVATLGYGTADLYYNLAGAYYKLGQEHATSGGRAFSEGELGRAVLNYHRALKLDPTMEDASYNLEIAQDQTNDTEAVPEGLIASLWHSMGNSMTSNAWVILSFVMLGVTLVLWLIYLLSKRIGLRKMTFFLSIITLACALISTAEAVSERSAQQRNDRAVVICNDITAVHASPDSASKVIRQPSQGVTVTILRNHDEWNEVLFADGEKGWIRSNSIELI